MEQSGRNGHLEISDGEDQLDEMEVLEASEWNQQRQRGGGGWKRFLLLSSFVILSGILLGVWAMSLSQHTTNGGNSDTAVDATDSADGVDDSSDIVGGNNDSSASVFLVCTESFECLTDRVGHFQWIQQGQALCNDRHRFGVTARGELVKETCGEGPTNTNRTTHILMSNPKAQGFRMTDHGHFQLVLSTQASPNADDISNLLQDAAPTIPIEPTGQCLSQPKLECPYLHLRKSGDLVLNSINTDGSWSDRKVRKIFPDLFVDE